MAARLVSLAVLVCDCSALLLGASTPRHSMAQDTVVRRSATVQMDLSSLVCDNPLAAIAVSSAAGTALGVFIVSPKAQLAARRTLPHARAMPIVAAYSKIEDEAKDTEVCPRLRLSLIHI